MPISGEERIIYPDRKRLEEKYTERLPHLTVELETLERNLRNLLEESKVRGTVKGRIESFDSYYAKLLRRLAEADSPAPRDGPVRECRLFRSGKGFPRSRRHGGLYERKTVFPQRALLSRDALPRDRTSPESIRIVLGGPRFRPVPLRFALRCGAVAVRFRGPCGCNGFLRPGTYDRSGRGGGKAIPQPCRE